MASFLPVSERGLVPFSPPPNKARGVARRRNVRGDDDIHTLTFCTFSESKDRSADEP